MKRNVEIIILLTATVNPDGTGNTALQDSELKKQQYLEAIDFYLENTDLKILFCENTGCDFYDEIFNLKKYLRLEFLTFKGNNYNNKRGRTFKK